MRVSLPNNTQRAVQRDELVLERELGNAVSVAKDIPEVASMSVHVTRRTVVLVEWVEVRTSGRAA